jgi:hypothetical protein
MVEVNGLEPMASCVQGRRSPNWATPPKNMVGLDGIEPSTSRLSGVRSDQTELQAPVFRILEAGFRTVYWIIRPNPLSKIQNPIEPIDIKNQRATLDPSKLNSDVRVGFKGLSYRRFFKNHP